MRDTVQVLEESGLADVLYEDRLPFIDLNTASGYLGACPGNGVLSLEGLQSKAAGVVIWPLSLFY